jgi:hypothetical protein
MKNFICIAENVNVLPLMLAVMRNAELWNQNTLRTAHPGTPHSQVSDIWLRFNDLEPLRNTGDAATVMDEHESIDYPAYKFLPEARAIVMSVMARVGGERLGRCLITKLPPGAKIDPHVDGGSHAAYYERFHIVLQANAGNAFRAGDETVGMRTGEVWWFDNSKEHEVINNSADDRIHMIVDIRCSRAQNSDTSKLWMSPGEYYSVTGCTP